MKKTELGGDGEKKERKAPPFLSFFILSDINFNQRKLIWQCAGRGRRVGGDEPIYFVR